MSLNLLNGSIKAEIAERRPIALRHMQGEGLVALLAWERLAQAPFGRRQVHCAVFRDVHVPGEAVEGHGQTGVQAGHGEEGGTAGLQILASCYKTVNIQILHE